MSPLVAAMAALHHAGAAIPTFQLVPPLARGLHVISSAPSRFCSSSWDRKVNTCGLLITSAAAALCALRHKRTYIKGRGCAKYRTALRAQPRRVREPPTPFPKDKLFHSAVLRLLGIFDDNDPDVDEDNLIDALLNVEELHGYDRQWIEWPAHADEARRSEYALNSCKLLRGILGCIVSPDGLVRDAAVNLLHAVCTTGTQFTKLPPILLVELDGVSPVCRTAENDEDMKLLAVLTELARQGTPEILPSLIDGGALTTALTLLDNPRSFPLEQLASLDLILAFAKRSPAQTAKAGAYDAVKVVSNEALVPRRNKIMNFLRPLVQHDGDNAPQTNIRIGGLKF